MRFFLPLPQRDAWPVPCATSRRLEPRPQDARRRGDRGKAHLQLPRLHAHGRNLHGCPHPATGTCRAKAGHRTHQAMGTLPPPSGRRRGTRHSPRAARRGAAQRSAASITRAAGAVPGCACILAPTACPRPPPPTPSGQAGAKAPTPKTNSRTPSGRTGTKAHTHTPRLIPKHPQDTRHTERCCSKEQISKTRA